ncbi:hypothetical protein GPM19_04170 [Halomonas sp. ZH2S]|uniref:Transposase n=1 Tax=Vreelandella zhuhanensis TaxID=2684210 RepID=A0A7X3GZ43_9GAMM|nr:transposase family protein [Halomonas zhuhanensis]MWJ27409.1 hypothetical protein [Halomonas zhuhanensis]
MPRYSEERKAAVLKKLLPPQNRRDLSVSAEEGISDVTLYSWLKHCRQQGMPMPGNRTTGEDWSPEARLAFVVETADQPHKLTQAEELAILSACNQPRYRSLPQSQIVPSLVDKGVYLATESSGAHEAAPQSAEVDQLHRFTGKGPNQVWGYDISYCPSAVRGQHWYLYLIMDIYSRKIIASEIHEAESGELAQKAG